MNRIARTLAALIVATGLTTAVVVQAQADGTSDTISAYLWCC